MPRQASTHACGVVITKDPVDSYVPLYVNEGAISTQYTMTILEQLGLLKMDFLGLRTLSVIQDAINLVKENREAIKNNLWNFPGGPVVKTQLSQSRGHGFSPRWGN